MNNHVKKVIFVVTVALIDFFVVVGMLALTLNLYSTVSKSRDSIENSIFRYKPVVVVSGSMLPSIQVNSINIVKRCGIEDVTIGDIVMYKATNGMFIVHRVQEINEENGETFLTTKGDNNDSADPWPVEADQVKGKIVYTCNAVAPLLTDILPSNGTFNAVALLRVIAILIIVVSIISILFQYTWAIIRSVYWVSIGNNKFRKAMERYSQDIAMANRLELGKDLYSIPESASIIIKLSTGLKRLYVYHSLKLISKSVYIVSKYSTEKDIRPEKQQFDICSINKEKGE